MPDGHPLTMRPSSERRYRFRALALGVALAVLVFVSSPASAHALGLLDTISNGVLSLLTNINAILGQLLFKVQGALLWILTLKITSGVTAVYVAWKSVRDLVNMAFIVIFIAIAFATIFNVTGLFRQYYWKQALLPLIIGAIVLNYSLAIGQAVALLSNRVAAIAVAIIPNPGDALLKSLQPTTVSLELQASVGSAQTKITDVRNQLTEAEKAHMAKCLNEEKTVIVEYWIFGRSEKVRKSIGDCNLEIIEARNAVAAKGAGKDLTDAEEQALESHVEAAGLNNDGQTRTVLIMSASFNILMMLIIISCLLSAFVFLAARIIVIWAMLALSPLAWVGYAIPGKAPFQAWWKQFIAWNVFGPLYVFTLIPGMHMLMRQGELLTSLNQSGASNGGILVQTLLFQGFALLIFIGGLGLALKSSFAGAVKGTAFAGAALQKLGMFDERGLGVTRQLGRGIGKAADVTGVGAVARARLEKTKQQLADLRAGARARIGIRTQEEALAAARAKAGVRGGAEEVESLRAKRITAERGNIEQQLKVQRAKWEAEGRSSDEIIELEDDILRKNARSGNKDVSLAAREMLMARTRIDPTTGQKIPALGFDEVSDMATDYAKISPLARSAFVERASSRLSEKIDKKEFRNPLELEQALASGMFTDLQRDKLIRSVAKSQPLVAAELLERGNGSVVNGFNSVFPGKNPKDVVAANFGQLTNTDVARLLTKGRGWLTPSLEGAVVGRASKLDRQGEIVGADPSVDAVLRDLFTHPSGGRPPLQYPPPP